MKRIRSESNKIPSLEEMRRDLKLLGWKPWRGIKGNRAESATIWQCPSGGIFRGPYLAWTIAKGIALVVALLLTGCTIAPHGSHTTHKVWTYQGRPDGLVRVERWTDRSAGGGALFLMDPTLQSVALFHTNSAMQVGGWFTLGNGTVSVDPQSSAIVGAVGTAVGNVIGAAVKAAVK